MNADLEMIWTEQIVAHVWNYNVHILELREGMFISIWLLQQRKGLCKEEREKERERNREK